MDFARIWVHLPVFKVAHSTNAASDWIATEVGIKACARHQGCAAPAQLLEAANINVCPEETFLPCLVFLVLTASFPSPPLYL